MVSLVNCGNVVSAVCTASTENGEFNSMDCRITSGGGLRANLRGHGRKAEAGSF